MNSPFKSLPQFNEIEWQEKLRRQELIRFTSSLIDFSRKIQLTEDFTTKTPRKLANLIFQISTIILNKIPDVPKNCLHEINVFINNLAEHLRYVERAKVTQTPWSMIQTAEVFFKQQIGEKSNFIIRPTWSYNYSVIGDFWNYYQIVLNNWDWYPLEELKTVLKNTDKNNEKIVFESDESIYCISFPRIEKQNCLMHANWGHEVGHIVVNKWIADNFERMWGIVEIPIQKRIIAEIKKSPPPVDPIFKEIIINQEASNLTRKAMDASRQGINELLCDIVGVHLFGLSFLAAVLEFASRFELDISPLQCDYYPPWRYRIRKMFEYCQYDLEESDDYPGKKVGPLIKWLNQSKNIVKNTKDIVVIGSDIVTKEAYDFVDANWNEAKKQVLGKFKGTFAKPYRIPEKIRSIEKLVERLFQGIPPNEEKNLSFSPTSFQDIITSAWAYKINKLLSDSDWGKKDDLNLLYRLVLKAIESSYIQSVFGHDLE